DGKVRIVHEEADLTRDAEGQPIRLVGTVQDVTDRKTMEEDLTRHLSREKAALAQAEAEQARLLAVLQNIPEGVILFDTNGRIMFCNQASRMFASWPEGRVDHFGKPLIFDVRLPTGEPFQPDDLPSARALVRGETVRGVEALVRRTDGQLVP